MAYKLMSNVGKQSRTFLTAEKWRYAFQHSQQKGVWNSTPTPWWNWKTLRATGFGLENWENEVSRPDSNRRLIWQESTLMRARQPTGLSDPADLRRISVCMTLNPRPAGVWLVTRPAGGGGAQRAPPEISQTTGPISKFQTPFDSPVQSPAVATQHPRWSLFSVSISAVGGRQTTKRCVWTRDGVLHSNNCLAFSWAK